MTLSWNKPAFEEGLPSEPPRLASEKLFFSVPYVRSAVGAIVMSFNFDASDATFLLIVSVDLSSHASVFSPSTLIGAPTSSDQRPTFWLLNLALAVLLNFLAFGGITSSSRARLPNDVLEVDLRVQASRPLSSGRIVKRYSDSSRIMPLSKLCSSHSTPTVLIPHCPAKLYLAPVGSLAIRCVTSFVRFPRYSPPLLLIRSSSSLR